MYICKLRTEHLPNFLKYHSVTIWYSRESRNNLGSEKVDIKLSVQDAFLEQPSLGTPI
jgi:hypothetical protein